MGHYDFPEDVVGDNMQSNLGTFEALMAGQLG